MDFSLHSVSPEKDSSIDKASHFETFYNELKSKLKKGLYRKVIEDINTKELIFQNFNFSLKILEIKIRCYLKIVNRKIGKYGFANNKKRNIETWLNHTDKEIDQFLENITQINENQQNELFDIYLELYLEALYCNSIFKKNEKDFFECLSYLSLAEKLIKERFSNDSIVSNNRIYTVAEKIYLLMSTISISNSDFSAAIDYQQACLQLCHKELISLIDLDGPITTDGAINHENHKLIKTFINIFMIFYHRGVTEENLGNYLFASHCYKDSKWFASKFIKNVCPGLIKFISDVEGRIMMVYKNLTNASKTISYHNQFLPKFFGKFVKEKTKVCENEKEKLEKKYFKTIKHINTLKFNSLELPEDNKNSNYINELTYSYKLMNRLMSGKVKDILFDIEKLNLHNMDKETKEKIQKKINIVNINEKIEKNRKEEMESNKVESRVVQRNLNLFRQGRLKCFALSESNINELGVGFHSNNFDLNKYSDINLSIHSNINPKRRNFHITTRTEGFSTANSRMESFFEYQSDKKKVQKISELDCKINTNDNFEFVLPDNVINYLSKETHLSKNKVDSFSGGGLSSRGNPNPPINIDMNNKEISFKATKSKPRTFKIKKETVEKFNYSKHISNKNFQKKLHTLDKICQKEIDFQKKLLTLKKNEIIPVNSGLNNQHINDDIKHDLNLKIKTIKSNNNRFMPKKDKQDLKKDKLEAILLKNLDTKTFSKLKNSIKDIYESKNKIRNEFLFGANINDDRKSIEEQNLEIKKKIEEEIKVIEVLEKKHKHSIYPELKKADNKRKSIVEFPKQNKSIENFIKIRQPSTASFL